MMWIDTAIRVALADPEKSPGEKCRAVDRAGELQLVGILLETLAYPDEMVAARAADWLTGFTEAPGVQEALKTASASSPYEAVRRTAAWGLDI
jgi:hypothetical protein